MWLTLMPCSHVWLQNIQGNPDLESHFCRNVDSSLKKWISTFSYMKKVIFYINLMKRNKTKGKRKFFSLLIFF
jgi:hypothetical protein